MTLVCFDTLSIVTKLDFLEEFLYIWFILFRDSEWIMIDDRARKSAPNLILDFALSHLSCRFDQEHQPHDSQPIHHQNLEFVLGDFFSEHSTDLTSG